MGFCLVAHGHSMTGSGRGKEIDKHTVVRMKRSKKLMKEFPEDYGTRADIAGSTTAILGDVIQQYPEASEYWGYIKAKHPDKPHDADTLYPESVDGKPIIIPSALHFMWLQRYYEIRGNDQVRYSTGLGLIIMAMAFKPDEKLILCGFDSIISPDDTDWSSTLAFKKYDWENDPPHDFKCENKLLKELSVHYVVDIEVME